MKNHDERINSIYKKADAYKKEKAKTRKLAYTAGTTAVCAAIVVLSVTALPRLINPVKDIGSQNVTDSASLNNKGVTIPMLELTEPAKGVATSMIGLVVYNGKIYTQAESLHCDESGLAQWLGEKLGTAKGNLDEWSSQTEYDTEFASTIPGDVYAVNGFSKDFRISIPMRYEDGSIDLAFFENLNGITVAVGADLYENLKLKENFTGVTYQLHEDWDYGKENYKTYTDITDEQINEFLDALYSSPFEDLSGEEDIYSSGLEQTHLYFTMMDGTTVGIRLFENGYVAYEHMYARVFVHNTDDIFKTIFDASTK